MANYVSKDGLLYFWTLLKSKFVSVDVGVTHTKNTKVGSTTKGVYVDTDGSVKEMTYSLGQNVTSSSKLTDTVTTATTTGNGNAVTSITATNGALTVTKGKSFLETSGGTMTGAINYVQATEQANRKYYITSSLQDGFTIGLEEDSLLKNYIRITGGGAVTLKESPASTSNSTNIATTAWVKSLGYKTTDNDTKNTAGSTASTSQLYLIGATTQAANPQTYSNAKCYVGTDDCLYSNGTKVLTAHQSLANYYNKTEIDSKLTSAMRYKGSVATVSALPKTSNVVGDMWNVTETGANYVWDGSAWDETGMVVDLSPYAKTSDLVAVTNTEIDTIVAS